MHVLIVEDDPMVEFIHRNYLEKSNKFSAIYSANSLQAAQEILDSKSVDLLLLDIHLKDGNGLDLLSHIRKLTQSHVSVEKKLRAVQDRLRGKVGQCVI